MQFDQLKRREFLSLLGGAAAVWPLAARAQLSERVRRVGVLTPTAENDPESQPHFVAFQEGLEKRGWTINRNLRIDYRWSIDNVEKAETAAAQSLALAPDVILARTSRIVVALQRATQIVPIVFAGIYEPAAQGFVQSLAHPGGNTTGFTNVEASV